ncbi:MAG: hypothetical protein JJE27_00770, partial [Thermoleophilia bacterium]|nr:hypothetical protein [Thermoleophilia bacterium]
SIFAAWAIRAFDNRHADRQAVRREFIYLVAAGAVAAIAFVLANPFSVLDANAFVSGVRRQQRLSAGVSKLGTDDVTGWQYYLWTLTWGWGLIPLILSAAGAGLALKRDWRRALPWVLFVLVVWLFMGKQERFYARWLMPVYPVLAVFAAYAIVQLSNLARERWRAAAGVAVSAIALAGPLAHVVHNDVVLTRDDTRDQAKAWLLKNVGAGQKIVIELIGPKPYFNQGGERGGNPQFVYYPMPSGTMVEKYARTLSPSLLDVYARGGYCYVVIGSIQKGRVTKDPAKAPAAASAYYKALESRADHVARFSPVKSGEKLPRFNFDISYNWYPLAYERPGPQIDVYRLKTGRCANTAR